MVSRPEDALNSGRTLPQVDPIALKNIWEMMNRTGAPRAGQQIAIGMDAIAAASPSHLVPTPAEALALLGRATVLTALQKLGVLPAFESAEGLNDPVFLAAATMPLDGKDLGEATIQMHAAKPPESCPAFEEKFQAALHRARENK